jgi:hypothetical protein
MSAFVYDLPLGIKIAPVMLEGDHEQAGIPVFPFEPAQAKFEIVIVLLTFEF